MLNISQLKVLFEKIHKLYTSDDDEEIVSVLSIDGASMNPNNGGKNGLIGYLVQPLKDGYHSQMAHIQLNEKCRFNQETLDTIKPIKEAANDANIKIIGFATDADPKTNQIHKKFYDFIEKFDSFDVIIVEIKNYKDEFPYGDLLHLVKAMRRKFLDNSVAVTCNSPLIMKENEINVLKQSSSYKDIAETKSSLNSMRDDLSLMIFNTENLFNSGMNGYLSFFTFEFIIVIMLTIIQSPNLSVQARIDLCRLGFYSMRTIKKIATVFKEQN